jgi:hypothetical protein
MLRGKMWFAGALCSLCGRLWTAGALTEHLVWLEQKQPQLLRQNTPPIPGVGVLTAACQDFLGWLRRDCPTMWRSGAIDAGAG